MASREAYPKKGVERKLRKDGKPNPKYVDLLKEDPPIAGQKWGVFSFISPEDEIRNRELFFFTEFAKKWDMRKSMEKFVQFLNFVSFKNKIPIDRLLEDFKGFIEEEKTELQKPTSFEDDWKNYIEQNEEDLQAKYNKMVNFKTNVRGIKNGGNFPSQEEAQMRAKYLRERDPAHSTYVGPVGVWIPWDPKGTIPTEYLEEELNALMKEKEKNAAKAKDEFESHVKEQKRKAIEENVKKAQETGAKLSQAVDEDGNLVDVGAGAGTTTEDLRAELFEGDIVMDKNTDHGVSQLLSGPFAPNKAAP